MAQTSASLWNKVASRVSETCHYSCRFVHRSARYCIPPHSAAGGKSLKNPIKIGCFLVLPERIELSTSPLPRECSTTELRQRAGRIAFAQPRSSRSGAKAGVVCHKPPLGASCDASLGRNGAAS